MDDLDGSRGARVRFGPMDRFLVKLKNKFDHGQIPVKTTSYRYFDYSNKFETCFIIDLHI